MNAAVPEFMSELRKSLYLFRLCDAKKKGEWMVSTVFSVDRYMREFGNYAPPSIMKRMKVAINERQQKERVRVPYLHLRQTRLPKERADLIREFNWAYQEKQLCQLVGMKHSSTMARIIKRDPFFAAWEIPAELAPNESRRGGFGEVYYQRPKEYLSNVKQDISRRLSPGNDPNLHGLFKIGTFANPSSVGQAAGSVPIPITPVDCVPGLNQDILWGAFSCMDSGEESSPESELSEYSSQGDDEEQEEAQDDDNDSEDENYDDVDQIDEAPDNRANSPDNSVQPASPPLDEEQLALDKLTTASKTIIEYIKAQSLLPATVLSRLEGGKDGKSVIDFFTRACTLQEEAVSQPEEAMTVDTAMCDNSCEVSQAEVRHVNKRKASHVSVSFDSSADSDIVITAFHRVARPRRIKAELSTSPTQTQIKSEGTQASMEVSSSQAGTRLVPIYSGDGLQTNTVTAYYLQQTSTVPIDSTVTESSASHS